MENRAHALAAGLFVLLLGAALAAVALWLQRDTRTYAPYAIATTLPVTGLKPEAPVRWRGLDVGRVESMRLDPDAPGGIVIALALDPATPVTDATYAQLGFQGVTGLAFVQLGEGAQRGKPLAAAGGAPPRIPLRPSLLDSGEELLAAVAEASARVNTLLGDDNQVLVKRTLAGLEQATLRLQRLAEQLEAGTRQVPALIGDAQAAARRADRLMADVSALTTRLDGKVEGVAGNVDRVGLAADDARASAVSLREEAVPRMNVLLEQLQRETRTLNRLLTTLADQPQSVVFGPPARAPGPGEPGFQR
jgi:phospholipid/cholesterol/gamma-HCH transport system substrate-binding protein